MDTWGREKGDQFVSRSARATYKVTPQLYGNSLNGAPLIAYLPATWDGTHTLIIAGIHGEEPDTTNVLSYALRSINSPYLRHAVILCANPDGMTLGTRGNARGVDLNRNFPTQNWQASPTKARWELSLPRDVQLSPGKATGSEPETRNLIKFIKKQAIEQIIAIHSPLGCINYDHDRKWPLVEELAKKLDLPIVKDIGYSCPGSMDSWAKENGFLLVTVELEEGLSLAAIRKKYGPVLQELLMGTI
jgi:murein peptide amidase A